jgi:Ca2+-binding EF-hand superfamily protein
LAGALNRLGVIATRPQLKKLIKLIDVDQSGRVEYNEFLTCVENRKAEVIKLQKLNGIKKKRGIVISSRSSSRSGPSRPQSRGSSESHSKRQQKVRELKKKALIKKNITAGAKRLAKMNPVLLKRAKIAFESADTSNNGEINFPEFYIKLHNKVPSVNDAEQVAKCRKLFVYWDRDGSGGINLTEFLYCLSTVTCNITSQATEQ